GGHHTVFDSENLFHHFGHGGQSGGSTGRVGYYVMRSGSVLLVVDTHYDGDVLILGRGGYDDFLGAGIAVKIGLVRGGKPAGRLKHYVHAQVLPRKLCGVSLCEDLYRTPSNRKSFRRRGDLIRHCPVVGVVL